MPGEPRVTWHVEDSVAVVRLDRPDKLNALDAEMFEGLVSAGKALMERPDVTAVVLTGAGRGFCAGLDLALFAQMRDQGNADVVVTKEPLGAARALAQQAVHVWSLVPAPVIAAVHGVAFGGGLQVALGADMRIVAPDAQLSVMEIQWGLVPDMMGTQLLPELVGRDVAMELAMTGRRLNGSEAMRLGLATKLAEDPVAAAHVLAAEIAGHSPTAVHEMKRLLQLAGRVDLATGLAAEQEAVRRLIGSDEQVAAVRRRLGTRAP